MHLTGNAEDEPPIIFGWDNMAAFVDAIRIARRRAQTQMDLPMPPEPFHLPAVLNVRNFKETLLDYAQASGAADRVDTTVLPCTQGQVGQVAQALTLLDQDPWIQRVIAAGGPNVLPIASVYVPRPRSHTLERAMLQLPDSLWAEEPARYL